MYRQGLVITFTANTNNRFANGVYNNTFTRLHFLTNIQKRSIKIADPCVVSKCENALIILKGFIAYENNLIVCFDLVI